MNENAILDFINYLAQINYVLVLKIVLVILILFWMFVLSWVINDARSRTNSIGFVLLSVFIVLVFNIVGLVIYLIIRPAVTLTEGDWIELEHKYLKFETAGLVSCPQCNFDLQPEFNICPHCGFEIKVTCSGCESNIYKDWEYCPYCGIKNKQFVKDNMKMINKNEVSKKSRFGNRIQYIQLLVKSMKNKLNNWRLEQKRKLSEKKSQKAKRKSKNKKVKQVKKSKKTEVKKKSSKKKKTTKKKK